MAKIVIMLLKDQTKIWEITKKVPQETGNVTTGEVTQMFIVLRPLECVLRCPNKDYKGNNY